MTVPSAICGYPLPGWRLQKVERDGDGWVVSLHKEQPNYAYARHIAMARSELGPLEAWDEALQIALRYDAQAQGTSDLPNIGVAIEAIYEAAFGSAQGKDQP